VTHSHDCVLYDLNMIVLHMGCVDKRIVCFGRDFNNMFSSLHVQSDSSDE